MHIPTLASRPALVSETELSIPKVIQGSSGDYSSIRWRMQSHLNATQGSAVLWYSILGECGVHRSRRSSTNELEVYSQQTQNIVRVIFLYASPAAFIA